jgi:hypothetical protein
VTHAPSHAGKLPLWERLVFTMVFALMGTFVVVVTVSAANKVGPSTLPAVSGGLPQEPAGGSGDTAKPGGSVRRRSHASLDQQLAAALRPLLRTNTGHVAVGVINVSTGARATFNGSRHFHAAGIEQADILAALLLQDQQARTKVTRQQAALAVPMIENSDSHATTGLFASIGGVTGLLAANAQLGLTHTVAGPPGSWGLTRTTVADQLRLLADLTATRSPLSPGSRGYELKLLRKARAAQRWGVSSAASAGSSYAIKDGWVPDPALWMVNSIGVVDHDGQQLLIAVLSNGQPTEAAGIVLDAAAAAAAARVITR